MAQKRTTTQALSLIDTSTLPSLAAVADLIGDWHTTLDRRVAAGELSNTTRKTYTIGADKFMAWATAAAIVQPSSDTIRDWIGDLRAAGKRRPCQV